MNVFVYPEIDCFHNGTRWHLMPPTEEVVPLTELTDDPRRVVEQITQQIPRQKGAFHIPGALWKRDDSFFQVVKGGSRYDPETIIGYNIEGKCSVDEAFLGKMDGKNVYCGPNNEDPRTDAPSLECALPQHGTARIEAIVLEPADPKRAGQEIGLPDVIKMEEK